MKSSTIATLVLLLVTIATTGTASLAQQKKQLLVCKSTVLASFKALPQLKYHCNAALDDYDEQVLQQPNRIRAIKLLEQRLATFTSPAWWQASVDDLNLCELRRKPGVLSDEEREKIRVGDYVYDLFGNHTMRLVLLTDPCYVTGYGGSNAFLLYRKAGRVFVSQVLDGFFSRADNPVGFDFAELKGQHIVEISTGTGGLHPSVTNYYFVIDPATNKAVPKKLFKGDKGLTNQISSDLLMAEPLGLELPKDASELNIIRAHTLAPSFSIYAEADEGKLETPRGKMSRTVLKWNGRFYE